MKDNLPDTTDQNEPMTIARRNRADEVTIHMQGSVTEWITSDVAFDRHDRGKLRGNRIETELRR